MLARPSSVGLRASCILSGLEKCDRSASAAEKPIVPIPGHCVPKFVLPLSSTRLFVPRFMGLFLLFLTLFCILPLTARIRFK
ncbi:hypothetical protein QQF64_028630 [Cirrhinus molitorella]|uniref:Uncharacterized protein n=1 Tax=Cirrhinus molitorella TaxID=172907 RepID=A0ABR3N7H3_9TELE